MSSLSPFHTIGNQIDEVIQLHQGLDAKAARARTIELLRQVEIADPARMAERYSFEYSGGMRQRVCIAMALACNPDILIADEPTTALDVTTQAEILDLIKRLQVAHGMAMLLITHDMGVVAEVADEVAVMRHGQIVEMGAVDAVFHAPQHPYTRHLLATTRRLEHKSNRRVGDARRDRAADPLGAQPRQDLRQRRRLVRQGARGRASPRSTTSASTSIPGENLGIVGKSGLGQDHARPPDPAHRRADLRRGPSTATATARSVTSAR